jgi:hypothetical protein
LKNELKDIKPMAYDVIYPNGNGQLVYLLGNAQALARAVNGEIRGLYTAEQMQNHAEAKCWELINWYVESTGDVNHAAEMRIWMDDEFKEAQDESR